MAERTTEELAQQLADMKWGDSLSDLEMGANEARALGRAFVALRQQQESGDGGWIEWGGGVRPVGKEVQVDVRFRSGEVDNIASTAVGWRWSHLGTPYDIIAYRVVS